MALNSHWNKFIKYHQYNEHILLCHKRLPGNQQWNWINIKKYHVKAVTTEIPGDIIESGWIFRKNRTSSGDILGHGDILEKNYSKSWHPTKYADHWFYLRRILFTMHMSIHLKTNTEFSILLSCGLNLASAKNA